MPIIDEKGKLFGKINIVDFGIVLIVLLGVAVAGYLLVGQSRYGRLFQEAEVKIRPRQSWVFDEVKVGAVELDGSGKVVGEVIAKDFENRLVVARVSLKPLKESLQYQGKNVKVGYNIRLNTQDIFVAGTIRELTLLKNGESVPIGPNLSAESVQVIAKIRLNPPTEAIMNSISPGDREIELDDGKETTIAEILLKDSDRGLIAAKLTTLRLPRGFEFRDQRIKVGSRIYLSTQKAFIEGRVIEFFEASGKAFDKSFPDWRLQPARIIVKIRPHQSQKWLFDSVAVGDKENVGTDGEQVMLAEILEKIPEENVYVALLHAHRSKSGLEYKGAPLKVGTSIQINTHNTVISAVVTDLYEGDLDHYADYFRKKEAPMATMLIAVSLNGKEPWFVSSLEEGDIGEARWMGEQIKVAEILQIDVQPSQLLAVDNGAPTWIEHPRRKDITVWLRVKGFLVNGEFLYQHQPIKIGRPVEIETSKTTIQGVVINVGPDKTGISPQQTP
jgi:hypothetical protein